MSLQYRKVGGKPAVDWEAFEETLCSLNPEYANPKFDSLKHVLTVLGSNNAELEVEQVRGGGR